MVLWLCASLAASCRGGSTEPVAPTVILHSKGGRPVAVTVEVADTPAARRRGLMFRQELPESHGMLFLFEDERPRSFWMKNTPLPLDILFIEAGGKIAAIVKSTPPYSLEMIRVDSLAQVVLEVNAGFSKKHGVTTGDRVTYKRIESALLPANTAPAALQSTGR